MKNGYAQCKFFIFNTLNNVKNQMYGMPYVISTFHYFKRMIQSDIWSKMPKIIDSGLMQSAGFSYLWEIGFARVPGMSAWNELKYMIMGTVFLVSAYYKYEETKNDLNDQAEIVIQKANEVVQVSEEIFFKDAELLKQGGYAFDDAHAITIHAPYTSDENSHLEIRLDAKKEMRSYANTVFELIIKALSTTSFPPFYIILSNFMVILSYYDNERYSSTQIEKRNLLRDKMLAIKNHVDVLQKKFGTKEELNQLLHLAEIATHQAITIEPLDDGDEWEDSSIVRFFEWPPMQWMSSLLQGCAMASGISTLMQLFLKTSLPFHFISLAYAFKRAHDFYQKETSLIHFRHELTQFYSELIDIQNIKLLPAKALMSAQATFLALEDTNDCQIKIYDPKSSEVTIDISDDFDELLETAESSIPSVKERGTILFFRKAASSKNEMRTASLKGDNCADRMFR